MKFYILRKYLFYPLFFVFVFLFFIQLIQAKCDLPNSIKDEFTSASSVFVGEVTEIEDIALASDHPPFRKSIFTFSVDESFKRVQGKTVKVSSVVATSESFYNFKKGEKYLVYAWKDASGELRATGCTRTKLLRFADEDIAGIRLILFLNFDKGWNGIYPLKSTRADVEKILGECPEKNSYTCSYETNWQHIGIFYNSKSTCRNNDDFNFPEGTVLTITIRLRNEVILRNMPIVKANFNEEQDLELPDLVYFTHKEKGLRFTASNSSEQGGNFISVIEIFPNQAQKKSFACK